MEDRGQKIEVWQQEWEHLSPESEIQMYDYFGLRQWILKYTPRFGKVLEAGCGLGRNNFYLSNFGVDIIGLDFSKNTIEFLKQWQKNYNYELDFIKGDVTNLPFESNSLVGYLSFGVVEHFIEGPQKPLSEAFRVLCPGGIAIISTPAPSWSKLYYKSLGRIKKVIKKLNRRNIAKKPFFQYEYRPKVLKRHVEKEGFHISRYSGADWLYTFTEFGKNTDRFINIGSFGYTISHWFETGILSSLGAQSIVIAIKNADLMHCFFCGDKTSDKDSLNNFDVPFCSKCKDNSNSRFYRKGKKVKFNKNYIISPPISKPEKKACDFCNRFYQTDYLFEDFGLTKYVCKDCLSKKEISIELSNTSLQPIWRKRISK